MFEGEYVSDFEKEIIENNNFWTNWEPEKFVTAMHPHFPNYLGPEWSYPPRPTIQAMYLFGKLKHELSRHITKFEMALEVCVKYDGDIGFVDIAVWYNGKKHAIEVDGNKKPEEKMLNKAKNLEPNGWIVYNIPNHNIENEDSLRVTLESLVRSITGDKIENVS
ncbi:hypothetical protein [Metabacillus halosaccharovorans]|uniref:hypothetical protein n=1 Tax=Metabacillus halosaccharovorans TaxID=930124 RepID=UPI00204104DC|nr:hypothetical protein [Metabacillus halosaccharovorans]MCM3444241.1 hypothetical protein [Metabacillus halosaccharovorans]